MVEKVAVNTTKLREAAKKSAAIHDRIAQTMTKLRATLTSAGAAWGADGFGGKFAKGEKGYIAARDNMVSGGDSIAETFGDIAEGQRSAADVLDKQESGNVKAFTGR